jgi:hypothetical protein
LLWASGLTFDRFFFHLSIERNLSLLGLDQ